MTGSRRVLMLGLDAADDGIVQQLIRTGRMPHLGALAARGVSGALRSPARLYAGGVWPSFYTGQPVAHHGVFHNKQWRPDTMRVEVPTADWTSAVPFWESWPDSGIESLIIDVPMVLGRPRPLRGAYLGGWGTHDLICRGSWPHGLWRDLERRFGAPIMPREEFGWQSEATLARLAATLRRATEQFRDIAIHLLEREPWQLSCVVFGALHRGGHYLWDRSQLQGEAPPQANAEAPSPALLDLYQHVDAAVGRIVEHAPADALVIVFAVHGMGPNPGWSDLFPEILARLQQCRTGQAPSRGLLYRLRQSLPHHWIRPVLGRLPTAMTQALVKLWSRRMYDWNTTRHFPMPMDESGYLRVNLRGRERDGIVAPGRAYDAICADLEEIVASLREEATGEPIADRAVHAYRDASPHAQRRGLVPDLIVPWLGPPAAATRRLVSTSLPAFRFEVPARLPSGRSGNHRDRGWFVAAGPRISSGTTPTQHDVLDLLPTIRACLGLEPDPALAGRPIPELVGR